MFIVLLPGKLGLHVAFNARLSIRVTLTGQQPVICNRVVTSVGGGYDGQTGVFTAPVDGLYCFMVTSTPFSDDVKKLCALNIMLDDRQVGYLAAQGKGCSTGHTTVQVTAGQKVWLRSYTFSDHNENTYSGGWVSTFTGMLLHPQL